MMYNEKSGVAYKHWELWSHEVEPAINKFLNEHPGLEVLMFDKKGCNGLWDVDMFYRLEKANGKEVQKD